MFLRFLNYMSMFEGFVSLNGEVILLRTYFWCLDLSLMISVPINIMWYESKLFGSILLMFFPEFPLGRKNIFTKD